MYFLFLRSIHKKKKKSTVHFRNVSQYFNHKVLNMKMYEKMSQLKHYSSKLRCFKGLEIR
jgi:hypothetical protein